MREELSHNQGYIDGKNRDERMLGSMGNKPSLNFMFAQMLRRWYLCMTQIAMHLECNPLTVVCLTATITLHDVGVHIYYWLAPIWSLDAWSLLPYGDIMSQKGGAND